MKAGPEEEDEDEDEDEDDEDDDETDGRYAGETSSTTSPACSGERLVADETSLAAESLCLKCASPKRRTL